MDMERSELKGKQTPGEAIVKENLTWPGNASIPLSMGDECSLISSADAALYTEAHNVANKTGMWPRDLQARIKTLEEQRDRALERLTMACGSDGYNKCPPMIREWLYVARDLLNKK